MARKLTEQERNNIDILVDMLHDALPASQRYLCAGIASALVRVPSDVITREDVERILGKYGEDALPLVAAVEKAVLDPVDGEADTFTLRVAADEEAQAEADGASGDADAASFDKEDDTANEQGGPAAGADANEYGASGSEQGSQGAGDAGDAEADGSQAANGLAREAERDGIDAGSNARTAEDVRPGEPEGSNADQKVEPAKGEVKGEVADQQEFDGVSPETSGYDGDRAPDEASYLASRHDGGQANGEQSADRQGADKPADSKKPVRSRRRHRKASGKVLSGEKDEQGQDAAGVSAEPVEGSERTGSDDGLSGSSHPSDTGDSRESNPAESDAAASDAAASGSSADNGIESKLIKARGRRSRKSKAGATGHGSGNRSAADAQGDGRGEDSAHPSDSRRDEKADSSSKGGKSGGANQGHQSPKDSGSKDQNSKDQGLKEQGPKDQKSGGRGQKDGRTGGGQDNGSAKSGKSAAKGAKGSGKQGGKGSDGANGGSQASSKGSSGEKGSGAKGQNGSSDNGRKTGGSNGGGSKGGSGKNPANESGRDLKKVPYIRRGGDEETSIRQKIVSLDQRFWMNGWLLSHPGAYTMYERELTAISDALKDGMLPGDITRRQLAYQIGGDEKFFEYGSDGFKLLRALGMEDIIRHRPMPKADLLYHAPRQRKHMRVLVTENLDPWLDVRNLMYEEGRTTILGERIHAVVLGGGTPVLEHNRLSLLLDSLGANSITVLYWGDIDRAGIEIMLRLREILGDKYKFRAFMPAYQLMVRKAMERYPDPLDNEVTGQVNIDLPDTSIICDGLEDEEAAYVQAVVENCGLIPQEILTRRDL